MDNIEMMDRILTAPVHLPTNGACRINHKKNKEKFFGGFFAIDQVFFYFSAHLQAKIK